MSILDKARVFWREHRERAADRKAAKRPDPPNVTVPEWLVHSAHALSWIAAGTASFFLLSFCIGIAGDQSNALHITHAGTWIGDIQFYVPLVIGFFAIAIGIPYLAKSVIPIFVALTWREHFWPKFWVLILTVSASFVIIAGSFSVQGGAIIEHGRGAAVAVEGVQQANAVRAARIADIDARLAQMRDRSRNNEYAATAANVGAAAYTSGYLSPAAMAASPPERRDLVRRALGAAQAADTLETERGQLRAQQASAATVASVEATPTTAGTSWIANAIDFIRGAWALMLSVLNDIVCLLMGWIALRLEQTRNRQMGDRISGSGWADEAHRIEDFSDEAPLTVDPAGMRPAKQRFTDADTGEEIERTVVKQHFRERKLKKGKPQKVEIPANVPPDEVGVPTGTGDERGASVTAGTEIKAQPQHQNGGANGNSDAHIRTPELRDEYQPENVTEDAREEADDLANSNSSISGSAPIDHPEPPTAEAAIPDYTPEELLATNDAGLLDTPSDSAPEQQAAQPEQPHAEEAHTDISDQPDQATSTALVPEGYAFDDEEQHDDHVRAREMADAK